VGRDSQRPDGDSDGTADFGRKYRRVAGLLERYIKDSKSSYGIRYVSIEDGSPNGINLFKVNDGMELRADGTLGRRRRHHRSINHLSASQLILDRLPPGSRVTLLIASIDPGLASHIARERILRHWERERKLIFDIVFVINGEFTRSYSVDEILQPDQSIIDEVGMLLLWHTILLFERDETTDRNTRGRYGLDVTLPQ